MTMSSNVNRLLRTAFPNRDGEVWVEWGHFAPHLAIDGRGTVAGVNLSQIPDDAAVYYCCGLLKPGTTRANGNVEAVYVLTVDDVGSKIDRDAMAMLAPNPTFIVETSPGNCQWQYVIRGGMDPDTYVALRSSMKAHPVWGHSEAIAPSNLVRLPMGVNGKPGIVHDVRLLDNEPTVRGHDELIAAFGGLTVPIGSPAKRLADLRAPSDAALAALLARLPNNGTAPYCDSYAAWINFGLALYGATGGEGLDLWEAWSAQQPQGVDPAEKWGTFNDTKSGWDVLKMWEEREGSGPRGALAGALFDDGVEAPPDSDVNNGDNDEIEALQRDVANMIVRQFGDRIRYNVSTSLWHRFDGTWVESPHALGYRLAKRWADHNAASLGKASRAAVSKSAFYDGVEKILRSDEHLAVVKTDFDRDNWLLGTPKGTVELRTGALVPARAADMISLSTAVVPSDGGDCPQWLKFMDWACTDPATGKVDRGMLKTLKQWAGYCLTGDVTREMVMFLHGGGKNGKGTYIETLHAVLGSYFYMATKDLFMEGKFGAHTEEIAALAGKRMVAADEVPTHARWNESLLKGVSGGGVMSSRHLYGRVFTFPIRFKVTIIGNEKPTFQGAINDALKRRLHLVEFKNVANPVDPALKGVLAGEAAGVLRWMINGLLDLLKEPGGKLFVADSVLSATEDYFNESDLLQRWIDECVVHLAGAETSAGEVFTSWENFRNGEGNGQLFNHPRSFKAEMQKRGYVWKPTKITNVIKDITVKIPASVF